VYGIGVTSSKSWPLNQLSVLFGRSEADHDQREAGDEMVLARHEWRWRGTEACHEAGDILRQCLDVVPGEAQRHLTLLTAPEEEPEIDERTYRVQLEFERSDDTEVAAATADRPEQIGMLPRGRGQDLPAGGYDLSRKKIV
jgi:hypothetical protein